MDVERMTEKEITVEYLKIAAAIQFQLGGDKELMESMRKLMDEIAKSRDAAEHQSRNGEL